MPQLNEMFNIIIVIVVFIYIICILSQSQFNKYNIKKNKYKPKKHQTSDNCNIESFQPQGVKDTSAISDTINENIINDYNAQYHIDFDNENNFFTRINNVSVDECAKECTKSYTCEGFTYNKENSLCSLTYYPPIFYPHTKSKYTNYYNRISKNNNVEFVNVSGYIPYRNYVISSKYISISEPYIELSGKTFDECIEECNKDPTYDFLTYNSKTKVCKLSTFDKITTFPSNHYDLFTVSLENNTLFKSSSFNKIKNIPSLDKQNVLRNILFTSSIYNNYATESAIADSSIPSQTITSSNLSECKTSCDNNTNCKYFGFDFSNNICKLYNNKLTRTPNQSSVIFTKIVQPATYINNPPTPTTYSTKENTLTNYNSYVYNTFQPYCISKNATSIDNCADKCSKDTDCSTISVGIKNNNMTCDLCSHNAYYKENQTTRASLLPNETINLYTYNTHNLNNIKLFPYVDNYKAIRGVYLPNDRLKAETTFNYTDTGVKSVSDCIKDCDNSSNCDFIKMELQPNNNVKCYTNSYDSLIDNINLNNAFDNNNDTAMYFKIKDIDTKIPKNSNKNLLTSLGFNFNIIGNYKPRIFTDSLAETLDAKVTDLNTCISSCDSAGNDCTHFNYNVNNKYCVLKKGEPILKTSNYINNVNFTKIQPITPTNYITTQESKSYNSNEIPVNNYYVEPSLGTLTEYFYRIIDNTTLNECKNMCDIDNNCTIFEYDYNSTCYLGNQTKFSFLESNYYYDMYTKINNSVDKFKKYPPMPNYKSYHNLDFRNIYNIGPYTDKGDQNLTDCTKLCTDDVKCDFIKFSINNDTNSCMHNSFDLIPDKNKSGIFKQLFQSTPGVHLYFKTNTLSNKLNENSSIDSNIIPILYNNVQLGNFKSNPLKRSLAKTIDNKFVKFNDCIGSCDDNPLCTHFEYVFNNNFCKLKTNEPILIKDLQDYYENIVTFVKSPSLPISGDITSIPNNRTFDLKENIIQNYYPKYGSKYTLANGYKSMNNISRDKCATECTNDKECIQFQYNHNFKNCNLYKFTDLNTSTNSVEPNFYTDIYSKYEYTNDINNYPAYKNYIGYRHVNFIPSIKFKSKLGTGTQQLASCKTLCDRETNCDIMVYDKDAEQCTYTSYNNFLQDKDFSNVNNILVPDEKYFIYFKNSNIINNFDNFSNPVFMGNLLFRSSLINNYETNINTSSISPDIENKFSNLYDCIGSCDNNSKCTHFEYLLDSKLCRLKSEAPQMMYNINNTLESYNNVTFVKKTTNDNIINDIGKPAIPLIVPQPTNMNFKAGENYNLDYFTFKLFNLKDKFTSFIKNVNNKEECAKLCNQDNYCNMFQYDTQLNENNSYNNLCTLSELKNYELNNNTNISINNNTNLSTDLFYNNGDWIFTTDILNVGYDNLTRYNFVDSDKISYYTTMSNLNHDSCKQFCLNNADCDIVKYDGNLGTCYAAKYDDVKASYNDYIDFFKFKDGSHIHFKIPSLEKLSNNTISPYLYKLIFRDTKLGNFVYVENKLPGKIIDYRPETTFYNCIGSCQNVANCKSIEFRTIDNFCILRDNNINQFATVDDDISNINLKFVKSNIPENNMYDINTRINLTEFVPSNYKRFRAVDRIDVPYNKYINISLDKCINKCNGDRYCKEVKYYHDNGSTGCNMYYTNFNPDTITRVKNHDTIYRKLLPGESANDQPVIPNYIGYINSENTFIDKTNLTTSQKFKTSDINACSKQCTDTYCIAFEYDLSTQAENCTLYDNNNIKTDIDNNTYNLIDNQNFFTYNPSKHTYIKLHNTKSNINTGLLPAILSIYPEQKINNYDIKKAYSSANNLGIIQSATLDKCLANCDYNKDCTHFEYWQYNGICKIKSNTPTYQSGGNKSYNFLYNNYGNTYVKDNVTGSQQSKP